jgi:G:T-mismatch repair DNA endonuclease (very short patch repair protein)
MAHRLGYRYRTDVAGLPGVPHFVFPARRAVLFTVDCGTYPHFGCAHPRFRRGSYLPRPLELNAEDLDIIAQVFKGRDIRCGIVWECEAVSLENIAARLQDWLGPSSAEAVEIDNACEAIRKMRSYRLLQDQLVGERYHGWRFRY